MLTAHLPAGYCLARAVGGNVPLMLPAALLGAVAPDIDMIFFYLIDGGAVHHHGYWTHIPFFWLALTVVVLPILGRTRYLAAGIGFFSAVLLHLSLDSIAGSIMWLYPFSDRPLKLATVPPTRSHWIWSFVFHWTFAFEIAIWLTALALWTTRTRRERDR